MKLGFCGPAYASQSVVADAQVCRNWNLEAIESQQGKSSFVLYPMPGTKRFATLTDTPVRGMIRTKGGRVFAVGGATFYELASNGTATALGAVSSDGKPVSMASSGDSLTGAAAQVLTASNGRGFVYTLATGLFTPDPANLTSPSMVGYSDGFFLSLQQNSSIIQCSAALDATSWDAAQKTAVSVFGGNVVSLLVDHREVILGGETQSIVYYDSGATFPFDPIPQAFIENGIAAKHTLKKLDNSLFWWDQNENGGGVARRAEGYTPKRISTHAVEYAVQGYGDISDAVSYTFEDQGHAFYRTLFPSANSGRGATWQYDVATNSWAEATFWDEAHGVELAHKSQCHVYAFNKHLVGDPTSGNIYEMAIPRVSGSVWDFATDDGNPIKRVRRAPVVAVEDQRLFFSRLAVDLEVGLGPIPALTDGAGANRGPLMMLRWSDDSAKTWSNEYALDCGQAGKYKTRVYKNQLGSTRKGRVFEVSTTDPIPWRIIDAWINEPSTRVADKLKAQA